MPDELKLEGETGDGGGCCCRDQNAARASGQECDVVLVSDHYRSNAHRSVLVTRSPYFQALLNRDFPDKQKMAEVQMTKSVDGAILETLIEYFYLGVIVINETNALSLLAAADLLILPKLKAGCWQFLKSHMNADNCLRMWSWAIPDRLDDDDVLKKAREWALRRFEQVAKQEEFLVLVGAPQLIDLISDDRLKVTNEQTAYEAAMRWVRHSLDERKEHLADILRSVGLLQCDPLFLAQTIRMDELIDDNDACRRLVDDAIRQLLILHATQQLPAGRRRTPAYPTLYAIGGYRTSSVEKYDPSLSTAFTIVPPSPMAANRYAFGCVALNERIIVIGGFSGSNRLSSVKCCDPVNNQWSLLAPLAVARAYFGAAVLDGHIYAVGGRNSNDEVVASMERYDPGSDSWTTLPPMPTARTECAAVAWNGQLYVLGGSAGEDDPALSVVEAFDPQTNAWSTATPMRTARASFGCAVYNDRMFVAGGWGWQGFLSSVETYNATEQQPNWSYCGHLSGQLGGLSLAVIDNRLLAIGGAKSVPVDEEDYDGGDRDYVPVTTVEEYVLETNKWRHVTDMKKARRHHGVAVVAIP